MSNLMSVAAQRGGDTPAPRTMMPVRPVQVLGMADDLGTVRAALDVALEQLAAGDAGAAKTVAFAASLLGFTQNAVRNVATGLEQSGVAR